MSSTVRVTCDGCGVFEDRSTRFMSATLLRGQMHDKGWRNRRTTIKVESTGFTFTMLRDFCPKCVEEGIMKAVRNV